MWIDGDGLVRRFAVRLDCWQFDASASGGDELRGALPYSLASFDLGEDVQIALPPPEQVTDPSSALLGAAGYERDSRPRPRLHTIGS